MVFKIVPASEWREAEKAGEYRGSTKDRADGFLHFSEAGQLAETLAKHYAGKRDLVLVAVDREMLGPALKFEASRDGALFPHLYAPLSIAQVQWCEPIGIGADGAFKLPARVTDAPRRAQNAVMEEPRIYSQRLGAISDAQFEAVAARMNLGTFVAAAPITSGLFGQNVFLTTSQGEFVLRGAPHWVDFADSGPWNFERNDRWQFAKESLFARLLHEQTDIPVPWPQLLDAQDDILGWPYLIMPRMPGHCFDERSIKRALSAEQRASVARALGDTLARQQALSWPFAGDVDPVRYELKRYEGGYLAQTARQTERLAENARRNGSLSAEDDAWIAGIIDRALANASSVLSAVYIHGDFKLDNLCLAERDGEWHVSGVFDLHESRFGDGEADLCRQLCSYLVNDERLATILLDAYRAKRAWGEALAARMPLYLINDRMKFWEYFTRPGVDAPFFEGKTFHGWATRYLAQLQALL